MDIHYVTVIFNIIQKPLWLSADMHTLTHRHSYTHAYVRTPDLLTPSGIYLVGVGLVFSWHDISILTTPVSFHSSPSLFPPCLNVIPFHIS